MLFVGDAGSDDEERASGCTAPAQHQLTRKKKVAEKRHTKWRALTGRPVNFSKFLQKCFKIFAKVFRKNTKNFSQKMKTLLPKNENTFAKKRKHFLGNRDREQCPEEIF